LIERLRPSSKPTATKTTAIVEVPPEQQPLLVAFMDSSSCNQSPESSFSEHSNSVAEHFSVVAPVVIEACTFLACGLDFVGSVTEFPASFAIPAPATFGDAVAAASAWSTARARADSAWAAAVVSKCKFNCLEHEERVECDGAVGGRAAADAAVAPVCVRTAADVVLAVRECIFGGNALVQHAVTTCVQTLQQVACDECFSGARDSWCSSDGPLLGAVQQQRVRGDVSEW
jgi:hypothetical protein